MLHKTEQLSWTILSLMNGRKIPHCTRFSLGKYKKKICGFPLALVVFTTLVKPCNVVDKMWWYQVSYLIILLSANNIIFQRCNIMFTTYLICLLHMYLVSLLYIFIIAVISLVPNFFYLSVRLTTKLLVQDPA